MEGLKLKITTNIEDAEEIIERAIKLKDELKKTIEELNNLDIKVKVE